MPSDADFQSLRAQVSFLAARVAQLEAAADQIQAGSAMSAIVSYEAEGVCSLPGQGSRAVAVHADGSRSYPTAPLPWFIGPPV